MGGIDGSFGRVVAGIGNVSPSRSDICAFGAREFLDMWHRV